jgi:hypothetical protein
MRLRAGWTQVDVYRGGKLRKMKQPSNFGQDQQHRWISAGARMNAEAAGRRPSRVELK